MKKYLPLLFGFFLCFTKVMAQRDTDHWIAPYYDSSSTSATQYSHGLYFSTDSVTPFQVNIYNNNAVIGTVTISKSNPQIFMLDQSLIRASTNTQALTATSLGIYTKGIKPYFLTLRIYNISHGEILTSKGQAGLGTEFYAAPTPITISSSTTMNFTTSIMATEDNTSVTVNGYNSGVVFINGPANTPNSYTFTLNKGQSYIFAGTAATAANKTGFIGAKIVSNKPITVTNGNANGMFGTINTGTGSDLIMDQSVPKDRLGTEFAMVRSLTYAADQDNMEGGLVVATEDNTQIFVNGGTTPLATINAGQWYRILSNNYIEQNGASGHLNMYVRTSKNAYLYQLLGTGSTSSGTNTAGYNYIPPLNCYLPRKIDEIGNIQLMPGTPPPTVTLKLNILTEVGAAVTVNGVTPTAAQGPYPLTGNAGWVTYALTGVTGNVTIVSNKAVTAGINGGYSTAGYGGYFAGFSSIPLITKQSGDCIPGVVLEVPEGFDSYQWFLNGTAIPGATSFTFAPTIAGNYTCTVTTGSCPAVTTPIYKIFTCVKKTTINANICGGKTFTPAFTSSTQTVNNNSVNIVTQPLHGTATVNPLNGAVTYTPTLGYVGPDTFTYGFCGNAPEFVDCEQVTVNINVIVFTVNNTTLMGCQYNGVGKFDLTTANVTLTTPVVKKFYPTMSDLVNGTNQITNPTAYISAPGNVYVLVTTPEGCSATGIITLSFYPSPVVNNATLTECFIPTNPNSALFDLTKAVVTTQNFVTFSYYPSLTDAQNGTNLIANPTAYTSPATDVYVRVTNANGCFSIAKIKLVVTPPYYSTVLKDKIICIENRTTLDAGPGFTSYQWSTGATTQTISGVGVGEYWVILYSNGCPTKQIVKVIKAPEPVITNLEVNNNAVTVHVAGGTPPYKYSLDGVIWQDSNVFPDLQRGQHTFYVKDYYNCEPISLDITVPYLVNAITPNGDGVNDFVDYSLLSYKENLEFSVFDRYGNKVHTGNKTNNYRWDGKSNDKKVHTGTYWYEIHWNEPNPQKTPVKYTGWILVKNRE